MIPNAAATSALSSPAMRAWSSSSKGGGASQLEIFVRNFTFYQAKKTAALPMLALPVIFNIILHPMLVLGRGSGGHQKSG
jgi:hypothetical protein